MGSLIIYRQDETVVEIPEIPVEQINDFALIGVAYGVDLHHCLYLGMQYAKIFLKRVIGYYVVGYKIYPRSPTGSYAVIKFYEKT